MPWHHHVCFQSILPLTRPDTGYWGICISKSRSVLISSWYQKPFKLSCRIVNVGTGPFYVHSAGDWTLGIIFTSSDVEDRLRSTLNRGRELFKTSGVAYNLLFSWLLVKVWGWWVAAVKSPILLPGASCPEDIFTSKYITCQTCMRSISVFVVYRDLQVGRGARVLVGNHNLYNLDCSAVGCCDQ